MNLEYNLNEIQTGVYYLYNRRPYPYFDEMFLRELEQCIARNFYKGMVNGFKRIA